MRAAWVVLAMIIGSVSWADPSTVAPDKDSPVENHSRESSQSIFPSMVVNVPVALDPPFKPEENRKNDKWTAETWTAIATVSLVIVTGFLAFFTLRLWKSTGDLVRDAKETAEKELRPYVFIESGCISEIATGKKATAGLTVKNYGKTPAKKLTIDAGTAFGVSFEASGQTQRTPAKPMGTLAPTGYVQYFIETPVLTALQMQSLGAGTHTLYVFGEIRYEDAITEDSRTTSFRLEKSGRVGLGSTALASSAEGNDSN